MISKLVYNQFSDYEKEQYFFCNCKKSGCICNVFTLYFRDNKGGGLNIARSENTRSK